MKKRSSCAILRQEDPIITVNKPRFSLPRMTEAVFKVLNWPDKVLAQVTIKLIKIYQVTFSPDHSASGIGDPLKGCKFYPSCSNYGIEALEKYGFVTGVPRIVWRVLRCHPWSHGGVDHP